MEPAFRLSRIGALLILSLGLAPISRAASSPSLGVPACSSTRLQRPNAYEVGLSAQLLLPNRLDDFKTSLPAYGPVFGIPLGSDTLHFEGLYGASNGLSLFVLEAGYRLNFDTPFLSGYLLAGGHFLHYSLNSMPHQFFGGNLGLGLTLPMSRDFSLDLGMKVYLQARAIVSFGGGFNFLL